MGVRATLFWLVACPLVAWPIHRLVVWLMREFGPQTYYESRGGGGMDYVWPVTYVGVWVLIIVGGLGGLWWSERKRRSQPHGSDYFWTPPD